MNSSRTISRHTISFGMALALCNVLNAFLVVAKEKNRAVQTAMQKLTGSHWVTHALVILVLFFALGFAPKNLYRKAIDADSPNQLTKYILSGLGLASAIIIGFYLIAD